jgi:phospholipid transport system substrate-binding protein
MWKAGFAAAAMAMTVVSAAPARGDETAASFTAGLNESLLAVMKDAEQLGYQGRYERLAPLLAKSFDFPFMARFALGRSWKDLDQEAQKKWLEKFTEVTTATYAGRFRADSGGQFEMLGEEPAAQDTIFVKTKLVIPDDDDVELTYRVRQTSDGWRVVDVYLNGTVSELALRRSDYSAVLRREGFDKLLEVVDQKIAELAAGKVEQEVPTKESAQP